MEVAEVEILILGAGIAGLGAALKAKETCKNYLICESRDRAGGLLDNFEINGFRFDNAVHLSFAQEPVVRKIFDQTPFDTHLANAVNFENQKWLKHPVQNNLFPLTPIEKVDLINSFLVRPELNSQNYDVWLRSQYGNAIAERFPIRYTKKYWKTSAEKLSTSWVGNRMRRAEFSEILYGSFSNETPNTYYISEMRYPKKGGFRAFIQSLINNSLIEYEHRAEEIDLEKKIVKFSNGKSIRFSTLVTSLPLPELVKITLNIPAEVESASSCLIATSIDLISVGFLKPLVKDLWFYIYDEDILASRAYSPSVKSKDNAPNGCSSIQFEVYSRGVKSYYTKSELIKNVIYSLKKMKIATIDDILFTHHKNIKYGNVIFDLGMEENRKIVLDYLKRMGVKSIGRFGEWDYLWSNQSFLSGYNLDYD